jgi:hypothetical protein
VPDAKGAWTVWTLTAYAGSRSEHRTFAQFHDTAGGLRIPTANAIWDELVSVEPAAEGAEAAPIEWSPIRADAERHAAGVFASLQRVVAARLLEERDRILTYIDARRRVFERIGLENVRRRRLAELDAEKADALRKLVHPEDITGELRCIAAAWVES